ncbi:cytochrome P450 [Streptomyces sp. NPDC051020]|uniref:cytochrome P450 n=1 Tax=Streptomyces sp. NPDC051020 TaxID=3155409 RepID=UPI003444015B
MSTETPTPAIALQAEKLVGELLFGRRGRETPFAVAREISLLGPVISTRQNIHFTTKYDISRLVLRDQRFGRQPIDQRAEVDPKLAGTPLERWERSVLPYNNPPDHTRLRVLVGSALSVAQMEATRPLVRRHFLHRLEELAGKGSADLVTDLFAPLPNWVMCELLGIDEADRAQVWEWTRLRSESLQRTTTDVSIDATNQALSESEDFFLELIRERRTAPQDDLVSRFTQARNGDDRLTDHEIAANINQLFVAGFDTVKYTLGNAAALLLDHPAEMAKLVAEPKLISNCLDEVLRFESGMAIVPPRHVLEDVELNGTRLATGTRVCVILHCANRDPLEFDRPDLFLVDRPNPRPLTFGGGIHRCLGAPLARVQAQEFLRALVDLGLHERWTQKQRALSADPHRRGPDRLEVTF